jgi:hypothetical protein
MCIVSNIGDGYQDSFQRRWPQVPIPEPAPSKAEIQWFTAPDLSEYVTKEDFEALKKEIEGLKKLIAEAQKFDAQTNQVNCDSPDKFVLVKWLAKALDVDLSDLKLNE